MFWHLVLCAGMALLVTANAQPTSCSEDEYCEIGYFCDNSARSCRKCLNCNELKREPLQLPSLSGCIKSVGQCGPCVKGLVVNHQGDIDSECIPPTSEAESAVLPAYVWVLIVIALAFAVLIVVAVVYVMRKKRNN